MKLEFEGTVEELRNLMSGDNVGTDIAVIQLEEDNYSRFFDENNQLWTKDNVMNRFTLNNQRKYIYDLLATRGYLFLNEAYDMLGFSKTKNGQLVGWTYEKGMTVNDIFCNISSGREFCIFVRLQTTGNYLGRNLNRWVLGLD